MVRSVWIIVLLLAAFQASAEVLAVVLDQDLGSPLEGVQIRVQGSDQAYMTDEKGQVELPSPASSQRVLVTATLLGYKTVKKILATGQVKIVLEMSLEGAVEGQELVVEGTKPQQTDAQGGLSQVVTSQDIQAQTMGIVEDAMSAIKTLPGVGYTGAFDARPSIDGGDPSETVATLDGAYILDPYQWSGTYTIFNPDLVDSIKLSDGIIGAPYGQVMSGLLEVNSKTPSDTDQHLDFGLSTTGLDLFFQQAFGDQAGVLLGGKVTWMEVPLALIGESDLFVTDPYIRNATAKLYWNPTPNVSWTLDGNLDTDGVAIGVDGITLHLFENETLVSSALKVLVSKNLLWNLMLSYNSFDTDVGFQAPLREPDAPPGLISTDSTTQDDYRYQARTSFDWTPNESHVISYGVDEMLENWSEGDNGTSYPGARAEPADFSPKPFSSNLSGKNTLSSGAYVDDSFTLVPGTLTGEGGLRVDHSVVFGGGELLQTYPVVNPRLRLTYTFLKDWGLIQSMDVNAGSGLYSQFPADNEYMDTKNGVTSLDLGPTRSWFNVVGLDVQGTGGETLNLQAYYKYYIDRFYTATTNASDPNATVLKYDGTGYAWGFDLGAKKQTTFWDFSLSYSFDDTELYNPGGPGLSPSDASDPLGAWYYPSYQVFNTLYADLTVKPNDEFSILTQATVASGTPTTSGGRTNWQYPVDVKLDWHGFYSLSKVRWEYYVGCEDVFALLYFIRPTAAASFNIGFPIPSVGYKLSY